MDDAHSKVIDAYQIAGRGNFDHARLILEETLYDHPEHIEGWLLLADLSDDPEDARQCYQMVLELAPNNWIAQQRMKLLFGQQQGASQPAELDPLDFFEDDEEEPVAEKPDEFATRTSDFLNDLAQEDTAPRPPTLKESYQAHKKFIQRVGIGLILLFGLGVISWVITVGYIVWKTGFLAWFGF